MNDADLTDLLTSLRRNAGALERIAGALERLAPPPLVSDGKTYPGEKTLLETAIERVADALEHQNNEEFHKVR